MGKTKRVVKKEEQKGESKITFKEAAEWWLERDENASGSLIDSINNKKIVNKTTLSFREAISFVEEIVESCIGGDDSYYAPVGYDMTARLMVLVKYGNFEIPKSIEDAYSTLYETNIYDLILNQINQSQLFALRNAAKRKIEYQVSMNTSVAVMKMNELIAKMDEVMSVGAGIFSGEDQSKTNKLMQNLAAIEKVDEKSIVEAFVKELAVKTKPKTRTTKKVPHSVSKTDNDIIIVREENGR